MALRTGVYMVPTNRWYIERTVWLIAGFVLLISTALALFVQPLWILGVAATGLVSINVSFTGFCPIGNVLRLFGFTPMLGENAPKRWNLYFMQTDRWYLERRLLAVGINITVASLLILTVSKWFILFTTFVGGAMVWFAVTSILRDGERAVLAGGAAAADAGDHAFGPVRGVRVIAGLRRRTPKKQPEGEPLVLLGR